MRHPVALCMLIGMGTAVPIQARNMSSKANLFIPLPCYIKSIASKWAVTTSLQFAVHSYSVIHGVGSE
jgi:hypothetical protein